ncbi:MAG TPA: hypothetical protein VI168_10220 [Croceibacterium sp.]
MRASTDNPGLTHEVLPGETHVSVFNAGLCNGIRRLFGAAWLPDG